MEDILLDDCILFANDVSEDEQQREPPAKKVKKTLGSLTSMRQISQTTSTTPQTPRSRLKKEMEEYTRIPTIDGDDDPLLWWKCHIKKFPLLSRLARIYLAISASSSPSERLFSKAGQIVSSQRAQLKPKQANMLIFLAENL